MQYYVSSLVSFLVIRRRLWCVCVCVCLCVYVVSFFLSLFRYIFVIQTQHLLEYMDIMISICPSHHSYTIYANIYIYTTYTERERERELALFTSSYHRWVPAVVRLLTCQSALPESYPKEKRRQGKRKQVCVCVREKKSIMIDKNIM